MAANLSGAAVNLVALREHIKEEIGDYLEMIRGGIELVIDADLTGPLGLIVTVPRLQELGVANLRKLSEGPLVGLTCSNVVYIVRPKLETMKTIAAQIRAAAADGDLREHYILFAPRKTLICERVLEEEGVLGDVTAWELALDIIPLDDDVISLEMGTSFRECYLDGDRTSLFSVAQALAKLQALYGTIPSVAGVGPSAKLVADMMVRMAAQSGEPNLVSPEIDRLILVDRGVDLITPLCTPLTYEGLINEEMGIKNTFVWLDPEVAGQDAASSTVRRVKHPLNSNDALYTEIRDHNFAILGPLLHAKASAVAASYDKRHDVKTIAEVKDYVGTFKTAQAEHKSLAVHTNITELLMTTTRSDAFHRLLEAEQSILNGVSTSETLEYIEECINKQEPLVKVLRLICLVSLTQNGLKNKVFEFLRREIVQAYGFEHLFTLHNLEKLGMFKRSDGKAVFPALLKGLELFVDEVNEADPNDISYVFSGYAPLSVRLIELAMSPGGWGALPRPLTGAVPGPLFELVQDLPPGLHMADPADDGGDGAAADGDAPAPTRPRVTLIFFIGGISYPEIAALRFTANAGASARPNVFIIGCTSIISGNALIGQAMERLDNAFASRAYLGADF